MEELGSDITREEGSWNGGAWRGGGGKIEVGVVGGQRLGLRDE
jgi:hypothetical protein